MKPTQGMCRSSAKLDSSALSTRADKIDTTGDSLFAALDSPARAIRFACAITESMRELHLDVRACVHTGECGLVDGKGGQP